MDDWIARNHPERRVLPQRRHADEDSSRTGAAIAREEYAKFLVAWKNSDAQRPELAHAREYIGSQKAVATVDKIP
jgi:hypothetical protein